MADDIGRDRGETEASASSPVLAGALDAAAHGMAVFPVHGIVAPGRTEAEAVCTCLDPSCTSPGKHPVSTGWQQVATANHVVIRGWFANGRPHNYGIKLGERHVVVEVDPYDGGSLRALRDLVGVLGPISASGRGHHVHYRGSSVPNGTRLGPGLTVRSSGYFVVGPGSTHYTGRRYGRRRYRWDDLLHRPDLEVAAEDTLGNAARTSVKVPRQIPPEIHDGEGRWRYLLSFAGSMAERGIGREAVLAAARAVNAHQCDPPKRDTDVVRLVDWVMERDAESRWMPEPPDAVDPRPLDDVVATFRRWLDVPDASPVYVPIATVVANHQAGDPLWLVVVGPSGGGKTEGVQATTAIPRVHEVSTLTEAALLSGTPVKDRARGARGGLLRQIGDFGVMVVKDLGGILTLDRNAMPRTLQALRDIYDGHWIRWVGTEGATALEWRGRIGFLAGSTPSIDRHHSIMAALGQRFVFFRLPRVDEIDQSRAALRAEGREATMRGELREAVAGLFAGLDLEQAPTPLRETDPEYEPLIALARLSARARSVVERDWRTDDIELVPEPEMPARLVKALDRLRAGLLTIGVSRDEAWRLTAKTGLDSLPQARRVVLEHMVTFPDQRTADVATALQEATRTCRRALEDLHSHRLLIRERGSGSQGDRWMASDLLVSLWKALRAGDVGRPKER